VRIGAYDPAAWAGLVFSDRPGRGFALRWAVERDGERADGADLLFLVHDVGPHDPDGGYARVEFDTALPFGKGDDTPLVKKATQFLESTPGKIVAGGALAAGAGALAAAKQPLPVQPPAIGLDKITPGLSAKVTVEGPLNAPTFVGLSLTYKEQGPKGKKGPTQKEQVAADIARLRAEQEMFKPQAQKQQEKADEQAAIAHVLAQQSKRFGSSTLLPLRPGDKPKTVEVPKQEHTVERNRIIRICGWRVT